jgi:hypothetical protein
MTTEEQRAYWRETQRRHRERHPRSRISPEEWAERKAVAKGHIEEGKRLYRKTHREEIAAYAKTRWKESPVVRRLNRANYRKWRYGITDEQFRALITTQDGGCAICHRPFDEARRVDKPHVDHDHVTKRLRGILCLHCNSLLGYANDNVITLLAAIEYLQKGGTSNDDRR